MSRNEKQIVIWLLTGCFLIYVMVVVGGLTRLTHSGLSMVEWKPMGSLPPMNDNDWQIQFEKYKSSPEYKIVNHNFELNDFKSIFWFEFIHRFIGRSIGVIFLIPFIYFFVRKKFPHGFTKKMLVLLVIGALQGVLGWFMVKSGLVKNPNVSHYRLAAHLLTAFTAFGFAFWFALDLFYPNSEAKGSEKLRKFVLLLIILLAIQIVYGGFVAGLKAGYLFPTFPKMGNHWIPDDVTALKPLWRNFLEGHAGVQFIHRLIAYFIFILVILFYWQSRKMELTSVQLKLRNGILAMTLVQISLGVFTILYSVPVSTASLHQTGAFILFSLSLFLLHRSKAKG